MKNLKHLCANYCPRFAGEPCATCLISDEPQIPVHPDEAEILPQCTACATKDHDLKALRKLQASNLSIYAGRVHSQQTSIMIREIIIVMLIVVCIALFLWGLR